jgi:3-hydroxymyristoyl/3-hydroxydecanoyl-(acyl carrier protein) dehydratase
VDSITGIEPGTSIEGLKAVSLEEYFLQRPTGVKNDFPSTLAIEALFQLGNFLIYRTFPGKLGHITMFRRIAIHDSISAGDVMEMKVELVSVIGDTVLMRGMGRVSGKLVIEGIDCAASLVDAEMLVDVGKFDLELADLERRGRGR